ncbi:MAG: M6 family metalloprotease domain-containing protein [Bacteroidales bacterium]|nr:M6 family metalloprotease domain-containing protein [Bacteroidales bacterium]
MKKIILLTAAFLIATVASAIPAKPGAFSYTQPDGSVVRLELHGDEFFAWTTLAGTNQVVVLDDNGYWRKTTLDNSVRKAAARRRAQALDERKLNDRRTHTPNPMTHGARHIPVLLVAYSDLGFSIENPAQQFEALLNEHNYSANGGTGSVQDFYMDNSKGQFQPIFDVYGPVTLPHDMKYYGEPVKDSRGNIISHDSRPGEALRDACNLLNSQIDFSQYDYDNDGYVDMTLFYYAGYNTAEGGSEDAIWPHQSYMSGNNLFDGKRVSRYFCTSELKGNRGTRMCGIGTTCHEFGHSLGLPDFYDTDYSDNGQCSALYTFSTMCSGSYNNDGRTPPYFNAEERIYLNWMIDDDIVELTGGPVSFGSVKDDIAYKTSCETEGEYFLLECRDGSGWDAPIGKGLLVYHVDKASSHIIGGVSAYEHWTHWEWYNDINAFGSHPMFYVIPSTAQKDLRFSGSESSWMFPGASSITTYTPIDWDGNAHIRLSSIAYSGGNVSLTSTFLTDKTIKGQVFDNAGFGIGGVYVALSRPGGDGSEICEAITESNGSFTMVINDFSADEGRLTFSKKGCATNWMDLNVERHTTKVTAAMEYYDEPDATSFPQVGIPVISDPENGTYTTGAVFPLSVELPEGVQAQVAWQFDGQAVNSPVTLQAGTHTVKAKLTYPDGRKETLKLKIQVQ